MKVTFNKVEQPKRTIFNPLEALASSGDLCSTSLTNTVVGQCPKCTQKMTTALAGAEEVHYCTSCRVCAPFVK
jgi:hypothetical protein